MNGTYIIIIIYDVRKEYIYRTRARAKADRSRAKTKVWILTASLALVATRPRVFRCRLSDRNDPQKVFRV